jgi:hypothetical protein
MFERINYDELNARQKENYNFQKVAARLADYGFNSIRLTDDWQGADFIAVHKDGETFLKVQLKARLAVQPKYIGKNIYIAFLAGRDLYVYEHDAFVNFLEERGNANGGEAAWVRQVGGSWPTPPSWAKPFLADRLLSP